MRASYCLPSGNYNIVLSNEELRELLERGHVTARMSRTPCTTSRAIFNDEKGKMEIRGELDMTKAKVSMSEATLVVGLTLKQAKMRLGIKS